MFLLKGCTKFKTPGSSMLHLHPRHICAILKVKENWVLKVQFEKLELFYVQDLFRNMHREGISIINVLP